MSYKAPISPPRPKLLCRSPWGGQPGSLWGLWSWAGHCHCPGSAHGASLEPPQLQHRKNWPIAST